MHDFSELEQCLGYEFEDKTLITEALTHKSFTKEYNNERLEFLGDAVLDLIIGEYLFTKFSHYEEGILSKLRASLVDEESFTQLAKSIHLGDYIYISQAEENNNGRNKPSLLSNAFEAVMGAVYLEAGLEKVKRITLRILHTTYHEITPDKLLKDYKTTLQEITQAHFGCTPNYMLINSYGPDHKKEFEIAVMINEKEYARAKGHSKKVAQQQGAQKAIDALKKDLS